MVCRNMNTWITSDLHFGHKNILTFCPETRSKYNNDIDYMNEQIILEWNTIVSNCDTVYILGDVAFLSCEKACKILNSLNGNKILIEGNHDKHLLEKIEFRNCFKEIHKYLSIKYNGYDIILFHYPILEWDRMQYGSVHFHGHLHHKNSGLETFRCRNVGFDYTGNIVSSLDSMIEDALNGIIKSHHS